MRYISSNSLSYIYVFSWSFVSFFSLTLLLSPRPFLLCRIRVSNHQNFSCNHSQESLYKLLSWKHWQYKELSSIRTRKSTQHNHLYRFQKQKPWFFSKNFSHMCAKIVSYCIVLLHILRLRNNSAYDWWRWKSWTLNQKFLLCVVSLHCLHQLELAWSVFKMLLQILSLAIGNYYNPL